MSATRRDFLTQSVLISAAGILGRAASATESGSWKLATFRCDVTPPVGHPLLGNSFAPSTGIRDTLDARGIVLIGPGCPLVLVVLDWCEIRNDSFQRWKEVLAEAAATTPDRVLVHTVHQHDAPYFDLTAQKLLAASQAGGSMLDATFHEDCVQRAAMALKSSLPMATEMTQIGIGQAKVEKLASNRRVDENGKVSYRRFSRCNDPLLRALPEGEIDPWLKTISLWNHDNPLLALSAYACHPMSNYGNGDISGDFPNLARNIRDAANPRAFQIYATGCCGDVTAGKFNDGAPGNRVLFADRLAKGMASAWANTQKHPLNSITFRNETIVMPHSELPTMSEVALRERLNDNRIPLAARVQAALGLSSLQHHPDGHQIEIPMIDFGVAQLLLLPAESFVAYQLFAQRQRPDGFAMCLGFGESAPGYIPTNQAFAEGFREEHGYTWNRPQSEDLLKEALKKVLAN